MLENITLINIYGVVVAGMISVVWVYVFFCRGKKYNSILIEDIQKVYKKTALTYRIFFIFVTCITLLFGILFSVPVNTIEKEKIKKNGIDIQIIFDVSYSMIAQDITPSRIEVAKKVVSDFTGQLQADRLGVILFAGKPFTSIPLSFDYVFIQNFLQDISVDVINQDHPQLAGTAIWDALVLGADVLLKQEPQREKIIILLTDGEANRWLDPLVALSYVKDQGIKTYTIGVWKDDTTFIDIPDSFWFVQRLQVWWIDEETLQKISSETGWKYYRADSKQELDRIFRDISRLEKKEIEVENLQIYTPLFTEVLLWMLLLCMWVLYIIFRKKIIL